MREILGLFCKISCVVLFAAASAQAYTAPVYTSPIIPDRAHPEQVTFAEYKQALRAALVAAGVDKRIRDAGTGKRYLLKVAHNDGRGIDSYFEEQSFGMLEEILHLHPDGDRELARRKGEFNFSAIDKLLGDWNVRKYPSVVSYEMARAWAELVTEWGGEPWIGDKSGIESPDTYKNMKLNVPARPGHPEKLGVYQAAVDAHARLWILDKGLVDLASPTEKYFTQWAGQDLTRYSEFASDHLPSYSGGRGMLPEAMDNGFFQGIFFAAFPKSHVLTGLTSAIKNFVGVMHASQRRDMHNLTATDPPMKMIVTHNKVKNSDQMIAEMAFALQERMGSRIIGYLGDGVSTITNGGPDIGPVTEFQPEDRTVTFSPDLYSQEVATLMVSMTAVQHRMGWFARHLKWAPSIQFNRYFRSGNPFSYPVLDYYSDAMASSGVKPESMQWSWLAPTASTSQLVVDISKSARKYQSKLPIHLTFPVEKH